MKSKGENPKIHVTAIIGNGFDIGVLKSIGKRNDELTTFSNFFDWLTNRHFDPRNRIYAAMEKGKRQNDNNWSDLEITISKQLMECKFSDECITDTDVIRQQLSIFMNEMVKSEDLVQISKLVAEQDLGNQTFRSFEGDVDNMFDDVMHVVVSNHSEVYWNFLNLNYTSILENYFMKIRELHPFKSSKNNFQLIPEPKNDPKWTPFVQLFTDFYHPHGIQDVSQSMILGTSDADLSKDKAAWIYDKTYSGRLRDRYEDILDQTMLFIIYGTSLGITDTYWWTQISERVVAGNSELIIYWYGSENENEVFDIFENSVDKKIRKQVKEARESIRIVTFSEQKPLQYGFIMPKRNGKHF